MTLTGAMVVDHFRHHDHNVFPIIGVHVVGMYALVIVVGDVIDRIGRTLSLSGGLLVMGASVSGLVWVESVPATAAALFGLGLGWNLSYVAATAELAERTEPWERGRLLGLNDLLSGATGAGLTLLGGLVLTTVGGRSPGDRRHGAAGRARPVDPPPAHHRTTTLGKGPEHMTDRQRRRDAHGR